MARFNGTYSFCVYDLQGDIVALVDANGTQVVEYYYDVWGAPISKTGTMAATLGTVNPLQYRGYVYDEETGLYYLRSRYYNPVWKRFINSDTIIPVSGELKRINIFAYCGNTPVSNSDASGRFFGIDDIFTGPIDELIVLGGMGILWGAKKAKEVIDQLLDSRTNNPVRSLAQKESTELGISDIASRFDNLYCKDAADAVSSYLKKKRRKHNLVTLNFVNALNGFVVSKENGNTAISENGFHYGIEYAEKVYCNVYPMGLPYDEWVNSFIAVDQSFQLITPIVTRTPLY